MGRRNLAWAVGLTMTCWLVTGPVQAAKPGRSFSIGRPASESIGLDQMDIIAHQSEYDGHVHQYQVRGDVHITLRDMVVTCDEATIFTTVKEDRVERLVFTGRVEARRGSNTFRGDRVTYFVGDRRLLAEGGTHTKLVLPTASPMPTRGKRDPHD